MLVTQDVVYPSLTAGGVGGADLWETGPDDSTCCFHNLLKGLLLSLGAAGKPHQESIGQYAANCTVLKVYHELLRDLRSSEFP